MSGQRDRALSRWPPRRRQAISASDQACSSPSVTGAWASTTCWTCSHRLRTDPGLAAALPEVGVVDVRHDDDRRQPQAAPLAQVEGIPLAAQAHAHILQQRLLVVDVLSVLDVPDPNLFERLAG